MNRLFYSWYICRFVWCYPWHVRLLATPEKLCTEDLTSTLATVYSNDRLSRLVIDEVWFLPKYGWTDLDVPPGTLYLREPDFRISCHSSVYQSLGMGSQLQRRVSQTWFLPRSFSRCPDHGFNGDCHQKVITELLSCLSHTYLLQCSARHYPKSQDDRR